MAIYCLFLQKSNVFRRLAAFVLNMSECFNQKSTRATCRVIHLVAKLRVYQSTTNFTICLGVKYSPKSVPILTEFFRKYSNASPLTSESASSSFNADSLSTIFLRLSGLLISKCLWNTSLLWLYSLTSFGRMTLLIY